ncbi:MAG: hypothetical protein EPN94_06190 [Nitrospirae bacterium]|nr:MAG: hypothetical protein EPN94_06190 [Nitrospirota bacterium]
MNTRDYYELFRFLMEQHCLLQEDILFVENIAEWCKEHGIPEPDNEKPLKLILKTPMGCKMLVRENIPEKVIDERINALRIRGQVQNAAVDRAELLDSAQKKLAYLFLSEYASSLPDISDELDADNWAFEQLEGFEFLKK